ncbi:cytochrome P450 [Leptodontidium sp. 2 PMI_412]|nr:cytochrome P450 [Leptodontidium sp. 2 PMI_412]
MEHLSELVSRRRPSPCLKDLYLTFKFQGPEEITIFDPEVVVVMNGPGTVRDFDTRITKYAEQLNQIIVAPLGRPVNLYDLFSFYTSDVMNDLSFGKSFGNLLGGKFHDSVVGVRDFMSVFGTLSPVPCDSMETTLINLFANFSRYPKCQEQILKEIQTLPSILNFSAVLKLPVLKSVIMETLRLWPPVPTGSGRLIPPGGLSIAGKCIPERTVIFTPKYTIARLESCFERATEFIPERWTTSPEMVIDKRGYSPFSTGRYSCVGQRLAMRNISHLAALLISKYTVEFGPDDDGTRFVRDMQDNFTLNPGRLDLIFKLRKAE